VQAKLAEEIAGNSGLMRLLPARFTSNRQQPKVKLIGWRGSGDLAANARANCYIVLPPQAESFQTDEIVTILLR
jgi:molybdopterin molybdotransferase